ncbi:MAG TPA: shikimate kinase [Bryobacteraceae bacterium]|nr:shikimate kinase [Bryobacteraceae bacterium]
MILKLKRTPGIYLVGFMGSGKTTIGRLLAEELGWSFVDLDQEIEDAAGVSIVQIFDAQGEAEFRKIEEEAMRRRVREVERGKPMVVALGGGAFVQEANRALLSERGVTIWLDCAFSRVCDRLAGTSHRPLAKDAEKFKQLYEDRRAAYNQAEYRIEIDSDDPAAAVAAILKLPIF